MSAINILLLRDLMRAKDSQIREFTNKEFGRDKKGHLTIRPNDEWLNKEDNE